MPQLEQYLDMAMARVRTGAGAVPGYGAVASWHKWVRPLYNWGHVIDHGTEIATS